MLRKLSFFCLLLYLIVLKCDIAFAHSFDHDGWHIDITSKGSLISKISATYTITENDINEDNIDIDLSFLIRYINYSMSLDPNKIKVSPNINLTIENRSGKKITFSDYQFKTSGYQENDDIVDYKVTDMSIFGNNTIALGNILKLYKENIEEQKFNILDNKSLKIPTLNTIGFDKEFIKINSLFYRPQSKPMVALLGSENLTVNEISNIDSRVKGTFSFININGKEINLEEDFNRTYGQYVKLYYDVDSLIDLTDDQLYDYFNSNVLINGYDSLVSDGIGKGHKFIKMEDINTSVNDEFKRWGSAIVSKYNNEYVFSKFYMLEADVELQQLAYRYLYNNIIRFTFDNREMPLTNLNNSNHNMSILNYINKDSNINQLVYQQFKYGSVINDGDVISLPNIEVRRMPVTSFDSNNFLDFGLSLNYDVVDEYKRDVIITQYGDNQDSVVENMIYKLQYKDHDDNWCDLNKYNFLKSDSEGVIIINNLGIGDYRLVAKISPAGYDLPNSIDFTIMEESDFTPLLLTSFAKSNNSGHQLISINMNNKNDIRSNIFKYAFIIILSILSLLLCIFTYKKVCRK